MTTPRHTLRRAWPLLVAAAMLSGCIGKSKPTEAHDVNLYSGIRGIASLGDSEAQMMHRAPASSHDKKPASEEPGLEKLGITSIYYFKDLGTRVYFRAGHVDLIALQEPFRGSIQGKSLRIFSFGALPEGKTWEDLLIREFGGPTARASGGRFGSEALFYSWGDVSFNRNGPNEIAIYREPDISRYRLRNFGRDIKFFPSP